MKPSSERYWRGLVLYGKNASTYKMGLGYLLLRYGINGEDRITLDDLSYDFLELYQDRCKDNAPQMGQVGRKTIVEREIDFITHSNKPMADSARVIAKGALSDMVLQRFNVLFGRPIPEPFYQFHEGDTAITLSDNLLQLCQEAEVKEVFEREILSRWDLLEHSFERLHPVPILPDEALLYLQNKQERKNLTPLVPVLWGYQEGKCFYCKEELYDVAVDHVIPYSAVWMNDVWNLVLAHNHCNEDKNDNIPSWAFIEKLIRRNEYYITSSHPLKDEIIRCLGSTPSNRRGTVKTYYDTAYQVKRRYWRGDPTYDPSRDEDLVFWMRWNAKRV